MRWRRRFDSLTPRVRTRPVRHPTRVGRRRTPDQDALPSGAQNDPRKWQTVSPAWLAPLAFTGAAVFLNLTTSKLVVDGAMSCGTDRGCTRHAGPWPGVPPLLPALAAVDSYIQVTTAHLVVCDLADRTLGDLAIATTTLLNLIDPDATPPLAGLAWAGTAPVDRLLLRRGHQLRPGGAARPDPADRQHRHWRDDLVHRADRLGPCDGGPRVLPEDASKPVHMLVVTNTSTRPIRNLAALIEVTGAPSPGSKLADVTGRIEPVHLGSTATADTFVPVARATRHELLGAGDNAASAWSFGTETYPQAQFTIRFADDQGVDWEVGPDLRPRKHPIRDW